MRRLQIYTSIQIIRKIALPLPFVFVFVSLSIFSGGLGAPNVYAQLFPPVNQFPQPIQSFPQQLPAPSQWLSHYCHRYKQPFHLQFFHQHNHSYLKHHLQFPQDLYHRGSHQFQQYPVEVPFHFQ